jgi:hypothetical protein
MYVSEVAQPWKDDRAIDTLTCNPLLKRPCSLQPTLLLLVNYQALARVLVAHIRRSNHRLTTLVVVVVVDTLLVTLWVIINNNRATLERLQRQH